MRDILSAHEDLWTHVLLPCWLRVQHQRQLFDLDDLLEHFPKVSSTRAHWHVSMRNRSSLGHYANPWATTYASIQ